MAGIAGVLVALGLLIVLSYRGVSVLLLAPLTALIALVVAGAPLLASYTQIFMPALGSFIIQFFPLFLLGAVFGKLMDDTGAAQSLARSIVARLGEANTIPAIVLACAVLTYGGVSLFVVAFAVYPIAAAMFAHANLPRSLIPASIALGAFTFTMTALPGTPAIQNAIPMPFFGTTAFAAPGVGVIAGVIMLVLGLLWLGWRARNRSVTTAATSAPPERTLKELREYAQSEGYDVVEIAAGPQGQSADDLPSVWIAAIPIVLVVLLNYLFSVHLLPALDTRYLAETRFGEVSFSAVKGIWAILLALTVSIVVMAFLGRGRLKNLRATLDDGANAATAPAFNTASLVGFGAVVASLPAFALIRDGVLSIAPGNPLISLAISVNILAGITGSASGGMSIALQTMGSTYLELGQAAGIHPDLLHRITAIATGGLDSLPHNGAVITLLGVCKMTHKEAYRDIFVVSCAIPILALVVILMMASYLGSF